MTSRQTCDVAIIGSGFAGSILARLLVLEGFEVVLLERGRHPRFALGESSTPLAGLALERLARRYRQADLWSLSTHGRWLKGLPHLRRGLKRGFSFYRHRPGEPYSNTPDNDSRLLVAASPNTYLADTQWWRRDVDHHLVKQAVDRGVRYLDRVQLDGVELADGWIDLAGHWQGDRFRVRARQVIDSSPFLAKGLSIPPASREVPATGLLYAHLEGLRPFRQIALEAGAAMSEGPYPEAWAANHHLMANAWAYVLPFDHGIASCGLLLREPDQNLANLATRDPRKAWHLALSSYPSLITLLGNLRDYRSYAWLPDIRRRFQSAVGKRWLLLPHAFSFTDPLFSTGIAWSLIAVERILDLLTQRHGDPAAYGALLQREADQIEQLVDAAYLALPSFSHFVSVAFLYFVAVSYAEIYQRIYPSNGSWGGFLGADKPKMRALFRGASEQLQSGNPQGINAWNREAMAPWNLVGFADPRRKNVYPLDFEPLLANAHLLGLEPSGLRDLLPRLQGEIEPPDFF